MAEVEFVIVANHVEAVNGLLYMNGGGWTEHWRGHQADGGRVPSSHLGIAVSISVPWTETNRDHRVFVRVESEDGGEPLAQVDGQLQVGRPAGIPPGSDQRSILALNASLEFPAPGGYRIVAQVGSSERSVQFRVHDELGPGRTIPS